jgi:hypothetical protein
MTGKLVLAAGWAVEFSMGHFHSSALGVFLKDGAGFARMSKPRGKVEYEWIL